MSGPFFCNPDESAGQADAHTYRLIATLGGQTRTCSFEVWAPCYEAVRLATSLGEEHPEEAALRLDVMTEAIKEILDRSAHGPGAEFWKLGAIELLDPSGEVIHSMPAKG